MHEPDNRRSTYDGLLTKSRDPQELKTVEGEQGLLTGYASKYWVVDSYGEATAPGSFAKSIADRGPQGANRILLRYEHEHTIGTHTRMHEDGTGLYIEAKASDDGMYGTAYDANWPMGCHMASASGSGGWATAPPPMTIRWISATHPVG
jgi:phage head maturation protease